VDLQPDADRIEDEALRVHRDALDTAEREIRSVRADLVIEPILVRGRAASAIVDEARSMPADLIVVGHRGHGRWESMLLGSVSSEVVDHAPCPVLVARDERLGPILFADDGSPSARLAEAVLTSWPLFAGLPVTVLTIAEEHPGATAFTPLLYPEAMAQYVESAHQAERSRLAENAAAASRLHDAGFAVTSVVAQGDPAHVIVTEATAREAGLIVVGTRGQTGLQRLILGSVARNVLLHAPCSVLIVRPTSPAAEHHDPTEESDLVAAGR
jgi:nucleotide-binding universal stress UspA family protein